MAHISTPHPFGKELCKALGLDPNVTSKIVLVWEPRNLTQVYVRQYITKNKDAAVTDLLAREREVGKVKIDFVEDVVVADDCTVKYVRLDEAPPPIQPAQQPQQQVAAHGR